MIYISSFTSPNYHYPKTGELSKLVNVYAKFPTLLNVLDMCTAEDFAHLENVDNLYTITEC